MATLVMRNQSAPRVISHIDGPWVCGAAAAAYVASGATTRRQWLARYRRESGSSLDQAERETSRVAEGGGTEGGQLGC